MIRPGWHRQVQTHQNVVCPRVGAVSGADIKPQHPAEPGANCFSLGKPILSAVGGAHYRPQQRTFYESILGAVIFTNALRVRPWLVQRRLVGPRMHALSVGNLRVRDQCDKV